MRDVLTAAQVNAPVTFPVRAALVTTLESRKNMLWLLNQVIFIMVVREICMRVKMHAGYA